MNSVVMEKGDGWRVDGESRWFTPSESLSMTRTQPLEDQDLRALVIESGTAEAGPLARVCRLHGSGAARPNPWTTTPSARGSSGVEQQQPTHPPGSARRTVPAATAPTRRPRPPQPGT